MAFLWESFLLSNQASSLPLFSLPYISICISFWFTSENDPLWPINFNHFAFSLLPPRDNWSELENGIPASMLRDKTFCNWLYFTPSICPSVAINLKPQDPHGPKDLFSTSHEMCNWVLKFRFALEDEESAWRFEKVPHVSEADLPVLACFSLVHIWFTACLLERHAQWNTIFSDKRWEAACEDFRWLKRLLLI